MTDNSIKKQFKALQKQDNLILIEDEVIDLIVKDKSISGVILKKQGILPSGAVVLTTGTFLNGFIHIGDKTWAAGRMGEQSSIKLAERLKSYGINLGRLKTGTPARLSKKQSVGNVFLNSKLTKILYLFLF